MSNIAKFTNALLNASNENTFALANLNFDFSLLKFEAPKEFQAIGTSLSIRRRDEAETGKSHKIARRLGALFHPIVPSTPNLIAAYGTRASQIATSSKVNPKGDKNHSFLADFVGIDGTSLWAAATSAKLKAGAHAPLAMHLLACMLARVWEQDEAISIWAELVEQRQNEIEAFIEDEPQTIAACMAARQELSRDDLAAWDASARAWLRSADEVKKVEFTKFKLIANNISVLVNDAKSTYQNVMETWQHAMQGMEKLILGVPQEASNGAVLLALSAWHIYPDLIVLGATTKSVVFKDALIQAGGVITVGLQYADASETPGMQWSLTLSHLSHYGKGVTVNARDDMTRVSMNELLLVAFGSLMAYWRVSEVDEVHVAQFVIEVWQHSNKGGSQHPFRLLEVEGTWLQILAKASTMFLQSTKEDKPWCSELVAWGRRRAKRMLGFDTHCSQPFFGLQNHCIIKAMSRDSEFEAAITYLREITRTNEFPNTAFVIRFRDAREFTTYYEFITVQPHSKVSGKRDVDGSLKTEMTHQRWIFMDKQPFLKLKKPCKCLESLTSLPNHTCVDTVACIDACHPGERRLCQGYEVGDFSRPSEVQRMGEGCQWLSARDITMPVGTEKGSAAVDHFFWSNPPALLDSKPPSNGSATENCPTLTSGHIRCTCAHPSFVPVKSGIHQLLFRHCYGDAHSIGLFVATKTSSQQLKSEQPCHLADISAASQNFLLNDRTRPETAVEQLQKVPVSRKMLVRYLNRDNNLLKPCFRSTISLAETMNFQGERFILQGEPLSSAQKDALSALYFACETYENLSDCTVSLKIASIPLSQVKWLESRVSRSMIGSKRPSRRLGDAGGSSDKGEFEDAPVYHTKSRDNAGSDGTIWNPPVRDIERRLACVILFDSGIYNIRAADCEEVIAVASANSIFVRSDLLVDPSATTVPRSIVRVIGNVGMAGISMLVLPQGKAEIRLPAYELRVVQHSKYDGKHEDNFSATSLHLRFTKWRRPYGAQRRGAIDEGIFYVESVVSVHDSGKWVADLDVLGALANFGQWIKHNCTCSHKGEQSMTSIDCWEEILDPPENIGVVRAKGNWAARLAALSIRQQQGQLGNTFIIREGFKLCIDCLADTLFLSRLSEIDMIIL